MKAAPSIATLLSASMLSGLLFASPSNSSVDPRPDDEAARTGLPCWEDGDCVEAFDVRLWPEATIVWLEQENLRDLIADPTTPVADREQFKRILAMQKAWKVLP